jgi:hypothetical protein
MIEHRYRFVATFSTDRELTGDELTHLLNRTALEIVEPCVADSDGLPCDAEWVGREVRAEVFEVGTDSESKGARTWTW